MNPHSYRLKGRDFVHQGKIEIDVNERAVFVIIQGCFFVYTNSDCFLNSLWRVTVMIREFQRDDINKVVDIWLDTNIKAQNFIPVEYWKSNFKSVKEALLLAEVYVYEYDTEYRVL